MSDKEDIKILSIESIPIIRKYIDASDKQIANEIDERMRDYVSEKIESIGAGISIFTSTVFTRRNEKPNKPTGGSYNTPLPNESIWSDGIPDGREILWASTRVFASDNGKMQQSEWSEPSKMTDTADFEALYSSAELPKTLKDGFSKDQYGNIDKDWLAANSDWHDEPGSDEIWMATNTAKNGVWGTWAISKIKGENGLDGKDGDNVEFIYYLTSVEVAPPTPESLKDLEELEKLGWSDHPTGVSETNRFEYFSMRKKLSTDVFFGNWSTPALWAKYGENGKDGDGLEYVYKTTKTNSAPKLTMPYYWEYDELYQKEEYIPSDWTDDPTGVDEINLYEWVSSRKYNGTTKKWGRFSEPKIWAKYGENGKDGLDGKDGEQGPQGPQGIPGADGAPGKLGNVIYPAGEYDEMKIYAATDKKSPYVVDSSDGEYYMLKENNKYVGKKETYGLKDINNSRQPLYNMFCIDPDDVNDDNSVKLLELSCSRGQNVGIDTDLPKNYSAFTVKFNKSNGEKYKYGYTQLNVQGFPNNQIKVLKKYYTLDSTGENLIVASKYIYSVDGISENWIPDSNQTPSQNALEENASWEKFESFEAIYAKIGIIENGTIGSAVYSGDFMFSQQGVDKDGNISTDFEKFKPEHIYDSESEFKPNICMNFKTGEMNACCGKMNFLSGDVYMNGYIRRHETNINCTDFSTIKNFCNTNIFTSYDGPFGKQYTYELDLEKTGSCIILNYETDKSFTDDITIAGFYLPSTSNEYFDNFSETEKIEYMKKIRSYVGNTIYIYNKLPKLITIVGINGGKGFGLEQNRVAKLELTWVDTGNDLENYNWISSDKQIQYIFTDSPLITTPSYSNRLNSNK